MPLTCVDVTGPNITYTPSNDSYPSISCSGPFNQNCPRKNRWGAQLQFEGAFVQVFGRTNNCTVAQFSLDGAQSEFVPINVSATNQLLYQPNRLLGDGPHTLNITRTHTECSLTLECISVLEFASSSDPPPGVQTPPTNPDQAESTSSTATHKVNVGGVVGGVIAALVVLGALLLLLLHWRRRQRNLDARHSITPFRMPTTPEKSLSPPPTTPPPVPTLPTTPAATASQHPPLVVVTRAQPRPPIEPSSPSGPPPPSFSLSSPTLEDEPPPPFVAGTSSDVVRHPSMYKPRSMESLPPTEYGYGGGLMLPAWRRNQDRHQSP